MVYIWKRFDPSIHHRQSTRLKGYDYSQQGLYFITIITQGRINLFGNLNAGKMELNEFGQIVNDEWLKTPEIRLNVILDVFVIMPNHFHGIIGITQPDGATNVGATDEGATDVGATDEGATDVGATDVGATCQVAPTTDRPNGPKSGSIGAIIGQFKMQTTKRINILRFGMQMTNPIIRTDLRLWQRNYYDHIIRNEASWQNIAEYISINPAKWKEDMFYND